MAEIPKDRLASEELRELLGDGPPYDTAKVMAWFEQRGWALYIELQVLEEEFFKHHPPGTARISVC